MSAHRAMWLHPSGKCDECDQERDQREAEHDAEMRDERAPDDGRSE